MTTFSIHQRCVSEILGTFIMVFCGTGAIVINEQTNGAITHLGIAITFGLVVMSLIYSLGHVSGAHMNPAVTIAFCLAKKFPLKNVLPYIASQLTGAILASVVLKMLFPENENLGGTNPGGSALQSLVLEFLLTFFLMLVIINVATGSKEVGMFAGLAIGSVVLLEALFAGPICGASMNPARSLGPALISMKVNNSWLYVIGPIAGAAAAIPVCKYLKPNSIL